MNTTETTVMHPFELAGLGQAPFRYVGIQDQNISYGMATGKINGIEISTKPGGTCAYCGTGIVNLFNIESADGNRFHVGCECVRKTGDTVLIRQVDDDKRKMESARRKEKKEANLSARLEELRTWFRANRHLVAQIPHPNLFRAGEGETYLNYLDWIEENTTTNGKISAYFRAQEFLKNSN